VEPDLKLGAGGLRCTHTANWIRAALGEPEIEPSAAYEAILRSRNLLHVVSKRANDRFTRARQAEVADLANRSMMEWISELCESLDANHRDYLATLRWLRSRRFALGSHLYLDSGTLFADGNPTLLDAASAVAIAVELGMDSHSIANVNTDDPKGGPLVQILAQGEPVNRALDRTGLLAAMLPELDRCRYLMPSDASHSYTVFEHTFRVVRNLDAPPEGFLSEIKASLGSPATLYLAALLHDTGKAVPGERHSIAGERLARDVAQRWNLDDAIAQDVAWLVREHLTMAHMIRLRDVYHQATAYEFAEVVRSLDRLQMLTLLTWADIAAVNAEAWTAVQDELLKELYERTRWVLESDASDLPDPDQFRRRLRAAAEPDDDSEALAAFVDSLPGHYLLSNDSATIYSHYRSYRKALEGEPSISLMAKSEIGASELTVCCPDVPGLLHRILGTLYAHDLSLHGLRACTTQSQPAIAIDVFTVGFAGRPIPQATAARLIQNLMGILNNHRTVEDVLREHGKDPARRQEDFRWQFVPGEPAIIEFTAPRGRGMPYRLSHAIALQGWNVLAARVGQWAGKGTASFYVEGRGGQPLTAHDVEQALRQQV
jgi:[protein-PII] uridylyltransferase